MALSTTRGYSLQKVKNLLAAAREAISDSGQTTISARRRVDAAYDAGHACSLAILAECRLECKGGQGGHHVEAMDHMFGTLRLNDDLTASGKILLRLRNDNRYDGTSALQCDSRVASDALAWANRIMAETEMWFQRKNPAAL